MPDAVSRVLQLVLTWRIVSVEDEEGTEMKSSKFLMIVCLLVKSSTLAHNVAAQTGGNGGEKPAPVATPSRRLTIEVTGGDRDVAVGDASVYLKFQESRMLRKDKKFALNVKTNRDGATHIPEVPVGKVLIQVVADGWKPYGREYDITDPTATIKIHLDRPPKWY